MRFNTLFVHVAVASLVAGLGGAAYAQAQKAAPAAAAPGAAAAAPQHKLTVGKEAAKPIAALQTAANGTDDAAFNAALAAAQPVAKSADEKYAVAQAQLHYAVVKKDNPTIITALQAMIDTNVATGDEAATLYDNLARLQYNANNFAASEAAFAKYLELKPNDSEGLLAAANVKSKLKKDGEAVGFVQKMIASLKAANQPVPENDYLLALQYGQNAKLPAAQMSQFSRDLVTEHASPQNWYYALAFYRDGNTLNRDQSLDLYRLMRASKALSLPTGPGEGDWLEYATLANEAGLPGEAQSVLNEGIAANKVKSTNQNGKEQLALASGKVAADKASLDKSAANPASGKSALGIGDAYLSYGNYARAADLYKVAIQKGGIDAGTANLRLGIAQAMGGDKATAQTTLKGVTGPSQQIAQYWALWLSQNA